MRYREILSLFLALLSLPASAQLSERFGPYELHYSVVNTTFLAPKVAAAYNLVRGKDRAILNLAVREHGDNGATPRPMALKGRTWDLTQNTVELEFQEVREGPAIYYIAEFRFFNEEWRHFEVYFRPEGGEETFSFRFQHQMYEDLGD
jgi:hypothetical protein